MKYCKKCKITGKESDTVCPKCNTPLSSFGSAKTASPQPATPPAPSAGPPKPAQPPLAAAAASPKPIAMAAPTARPSAPPKPAQAPPVAASVIPKPAAPISFSQPPPGAATASAPKVPTFTLAGQIAELEQIKQRNLKLGRNFGILSLLVALAILLLIYTVYSRTVLAYAILENIQIEQDPVAETEITVSFDVKTPGKIAFDRRSGTAHTEKVDLIPAAGHRSTDWSWPSDPKTGIDFSVVSRGGWFRTRTDKHFNVTRASVGVEVVFLMDITGSMQPYIDGLKDKCIAFADEIKREGIDCRLGLIGFGDVEINEPMTIFGPTADAKEFQDAVGRLELTDGGDIPESSVEALEKALDMKFRPHTRICFVHITDADCHNKGRIRELVESLNDNKIVTYVISKKNLRTVYGKLCVNGGSFFGINDAPFESILKEVAKSITNQIKSN
jgi:Mg-chelatase subunit ChlD